MPPTSSGQPSRTIEQPSRTIEQSTRTMAGQTTTAIAGPSHSLEPAGSVRSVATEATRKPSMAESFFRKFSSARRKKSDIEAPKEEPYRIKCPAKPYERPKSSCIFLTTRTIAYLLNLGFAVSGVLLLAFTCLSTLNPPEADVGPERITAYPQYIITLGLIGSFSICLLFLALLGLFALLLDSSFLMSLHILAQVAMLVAQFVSVAFTYTVRDRLHYKLEESWQKLGVCQPNQPCQKLQRFLASEHYLIVTMCIFIAVQIVLLIISLIICERTSLIERKELIAKTQAEEDECEDEFCAPTR